jgi:Tfp pilus assembly protein PilV
MQERITARVGCRAVRGCRRLRSQRGAALIEIMVAAMLTAMVATAVFAGIDGAGAVSSGSKSRAVAASIAQDDQERLRSTAPAALVDFSDTRTVANSGVNFTVASAARWVADRDATPDCNTTTSRAGYLRITSTVTWPDMRGSRPIVASSLVAPPNGTVASNRGAIGVKVLNELNQGVAGVSVNVSGAALSGTTDSTGCVYWDDIPQGNYTYTASKAGYVDPNGNTSIVNRPIGVAGGQTRIDTIFLDVATTANFQFLTKGYDPAAAPSPITLASGDQLHLANAKLTAYAGTKSIAAGGLQTLTVGNLYPMQYGSFVGPCPLENTPATYSGTGTVIQPPFPSPAAIYRPPLKVEVTWNGVRQNGLAVKIVQKQKAGGNCSRSYTGLQTAANGGVNGRLASNDLAYPYGRYAVCVQGVITGFTVHIQAGDTSTAAETTGDVIHTDPNGTVVTMNTAPAANLRAGACP